jgi:carboxyl-terminal processing protease
MDDTGARRLKIWTPLLFSIILIAGMMFGFSLRDTLRVKRNIQTIIDRNDRLEQIIDLINEKYVDTINTNLLYKDAIDGIISHLDPHTIYIPAEELQEVNEDLEGGFFGIGVEFAVYRDTMQVTSVVEGGPAESAGIETGDQIIKVGDSIVAGKSITSDRIIKMLKGKQYSRVFVTVKSPFTQSLKKVTIKRDIVPLYSVEANVLLDNTTGYVKIDRFSATTYDEFQKAIQILKRKGMTQLILDLRQNPGGYLDAATNMADDFLGGDKLIVYTKGKHAVRKEYRAGIHNEFENGKLVVLVDENSASASEVLAGAVQDWDRGVVMGRRTFGKGLVQEQYEMSDGSALRLTIGKYYTPSGRCIQRSFAKGRDAYQQDYIKRYESGEFLGYDTTINPDTTRYFTKNKRVVYGSIGIQPDIYVPYDTLKLRPGLLNMLYSDDVKSVIWDYYLSHRVPLQKYYDVKDFGEKFNAEELVKAYTNNLNPQLRKMAKSLLKDSANSNFFKTQMKAQLARILFHNNGYYAISATKDDMVMKAMLVLKTSKYSDIIER